MCEQESQVKSLTNTVEELQKKIQQDNIEKEAMESELAAHQAEIEEVFIQYFLNKKISSH